MKFYDENGRIHEYFASAMAARLRSKVLEKTNGSNNAEDNPLINKPRNSNLYLDKKDGERWNTVEDQDTESISGGKSASYPHVVYVDNYNNDEFIPSDDFNGKTGITKDEPFDFGSIDIDWEKRMIYLIDKNGQIRQSTYISDYLISKVGDINNDPDSLPDPKTIDESEINEIIDKFVLGKDDDTILSILDKMSKGRIIGYGPSVTDEVVEVTEDITTKLLKEYNFELPGGTIQGLVHSVIRFISKRLNYMYKDV